MTFDPNLVLFYVNNIENSTHFYSELLNDKPIHTEPEYVMSIYALGIIIPKKIYSCCHNPKRCSGNCRCTNFFGAEKASI